jgi:hypothetical protein
MKRWQSSRDENPQEAGLHAHQERFEIVPEENKNDDGQETWSGFKDARIERPIAGGALGWKSLPIDGNVDPVNWDSMRYEVAQAAANNDPPSWTDQRDQILHEDQMPLRMPPDVTQQTRQDMQNIEKGFAYLPMSPTDDNKMDAQFYENVSGEDDRKTANKVKGFLDRKNVLDRE